MVCVTTPYYSISLNGYMEGYFKGEKGLRQGDPMSPYLFLFVMQAFSYLLENYTRQTGFIFHPHCQELRISHLAFADDLFIMCGATVGSLTLVKHAIVEFGRISGLKPNLQNRSIFFTGVNEDTKGVLCDLMGMEAKDFPVRYLGVPLISTRLQVRDCECIKERMLSKIQHWSSKFLSYAGRLQLVISVLHSIQTYWCTVFILPKKILKDVDAILRRFVWSGSEMKKTGAKVAWTDVCCPKKEGGLGIKNIVV